jgi:hypothetical protein
VNGLGSGLTPFEVCACWVALLFGAGKLDYFIDVAACQSINERKAKIERGNRIRRECDAAAKGNTL